MSCHINLDKKIALNYITKDFCKRSNGTVQRTVNEAISGQILNQNANNTVQFRVETGSGRVNLRSVILWYQVDV